MIGYCDQAQGSNKSFFAHFRIIGGHNGHFDFPATGEHDWGSGALNKQRCQTIWPRSSVKDLPVVNPERRKGNSGMNIRSTAWAVLAGASLIGVGTLASTADAAADFGDAQCPLAVSVVCHFVPIAPDLEGYVPEFGGS